MKAALQTARETWWIPIVALVAAALLHKSPAIAFAFVILSIVGGLALNVPVTTTQKALLAIGWSVSVFVAEASIAGGGSDPSTGTAFTPLKLAPLLLIGSIGLLSARPGMVRDAPGVVKVACVYLGWMAVAAIAGPTPSLSFSRVIQGAGPLLVALAARKRFGALSVGPILLWSTLAALAAHTVYAVWHPYYTGVGTSQVRLVGLLIANTLEFAAGITVAAATALIVSRFWRHGSWLLIPLIVVGSIAIKDTVGRTAILAVGVAVVLSLLVRNRGTRPAEGRRFIAFAAIAVAMIFILPTASGRISRWYQGGDSQLSTLTNRTTIWHIYVPRALDHPFTGLGPGALKFASARERDPHHPLLPNDFTIGQAHNSFFEALIDGGVPAATLWLLMMLMTLIHVFRIENRYRTMAVALFGALVVESVTLGQLAGFGMAWFLLVALMMLPSGETSELETDTAQSRDSGLPSPGDGALRLSAWPATTAVERRG